MKKFLSILLICIFLLSALASCGGNSGNPSDTANDTSNDTAGDTDNVNPEPTDYGTLTLKAPSIIYSNYPAVAIDCIFSKPKMAEALTFTTSHSNVKVENGKIYATGTFTSETTVTITAKSEHFSAKTNVKVITYQGGLNLESQIVNRMNQIDAKSGGDTNGGVIFVGDSFFNPDNWWSGFYTDYAGKKAFSVGISSTTTEDWLILSERAVYPYSPKAVVVHCGTNDIFDDKDDAATTAASLKKLFNTYHERMPNAKIYWFSIEPRVGQSFDTPKAVNAEIKSSFEGKDWFVYIDSASWCFEADGTTVKSSFYKDTVHPKPESYALYRNALTTAGLTFDNLNPANQTKIANIVRDKSQNVGNGASTVSYRGSNLVTEYVISGKFTLTDIANNGHAEFQFKDYQTRFLLWDNDSDKKIGVGWFIDDGTRGRDTDNGAEKFVFGNTPLVLEWKLLFTEKNAYLYINGNLEAVYYNVKSPSHLTLSTEGMTASFTDMTAYTKTADAAKYNEALAAVSSYEAQTGTTTRVVRV